MGFPACRILPKTQLDSACSAALKTVVGMAPDSSMTNSTNLACNPESVLPCSSGVADFGHDRATKNHVPGWSFATIRVLVHVKACDRNLERPCHFASSGHRF